MASYKDAGVDIDAGEKLVKNIGKSISETIAHSTAKHKFEVLGGLGGFSAMSTIPSGMQEPILFTCTDGVGTKLKLLLDYKKGDENAQMNIGKDLVAMCVNDMVISNASPLLFLDYYATGKLDVGFANNIVSGIAKACQEAGCALVGGETAELPGMYRDGDFDLAGFAVGVADKKDICFPKDRIKDGDILLAVCSSGFHSNGYSLVRSIITSKNIDVNEKLDDRKIIDILLEPTIIYVDLVRNLFSKFGTKIHGIAHITGGGITENLPRIFPEGLHAEVGVDVLKHIRPSVMDFFQEKGGVSDDEMLRVFNNGIGLVMAVDKDIWQEICSEHYRISPIGVMKAGTSQELVKYVDYKVSPIDKKDLIKIIKDLSKKRDA